LIMALDKNDNTLIASLFPEGVATSEANPKLIRGFVYPEEVTLVCHSVPSRRQEFFAGRLCARRALAKIGIRNFPILMAYDRAPVWPPGIVGSISHADGYCGVAVAKRMEVESIGLDVERVCRLNSDCWRYICTQQELSWINSLPRECKQRNIALIFSAKECLYKCQYAISRRWLDFDDVSISVNSDTGEFEARLIINVGSRFVKGTCLKGKYLFYYDYVFTGITFAHRRDLRLV